MWTMPRLVRDVMGLDDDASINDREMESLIRIAQDQVREELFHYVEETVEPNPDTGDSWDGSNTVFQTSYYPVVDSNYDNVVDEKDISGEWINSSYTVSTASIEVINATYGIIRVRQTDCSAIPADAEDVIVKYYSGHRNITMKQLENLTTYLAAHFVYMRIKSGTSISEVDLQSNWRLVLKSPTMYLENYRLLLSQLQDSVIRGV